MILKNGKRIDGCTDTLPVGTVQPFLGLTPPLGYLVCQGQLISKIEYPELYNICKSIFGAETDTHFYLPDLRGKTIAGYDSNNVSMNSIGKILGEEEHRHLTPLSWYGNDGKYYFGTTNFYGNKTVNYEDLYGTEVTVRGDYPSTSTNRLNYYTDYQSNYQPTMTMNWIVKAAMLIPEYFTVENTLTSTNTNNALSAAQGKILNDSKLALTGGTLTGNISVVTTYPTLVLSSSNLLYNTTPGTTEYPCILWTDKNNTPMGRLEMIAANDGSRYMSLYAIIPGDTAVGSFLKVGWDASKNPKSSIDGDFTVGKGMTVTNNLSVGGSISVGSGFGKKYTFTKTLTLTTDWIDTGISKWSIPKGAYIVHMTGIWDTDRNWQADAQYAGIMSWYDGQTNANERCTIPLHYTSHATNGYVIELSTLSSSRSTELDMRLQIKSNIAFTRATTITFTLVKIV